MARVLLRYQGPTGGVAGWSPGETRAVSEAEALALITAHDGFVVMPADPASVLEAVLRIKAEASGLRGVQCR